MNDVAKLQISSLAKMFIPDLVKEYGCGWFDGGCFTLSQAIHISHPFTTEPGVLISADGTIQHGVIKVVGQDLYGDADGWFSLEEMFGHMLKDEGVVCTKYVPGHTGEVFSSLCMNIVQHIKKCGVIEFILPLDANQEIKVSAGLYEKESASIYSNLLDHECEGPYASFVDGIESMILSHFCAGVDVTSPEYCDGIKQALESGSAKIPDCGNDCVSSLVSQSDDDGNALILRSREITITAVEDIVYSIRQESLEKVLKVRGNLESAVNSLVLGEGRDELTRVEYDLEPKECVMVHHEYYEEL